jgi:hypothetical protein
MKSEMIKNSVHDEANAVTYEVMASRTLTDGEMFRAIRLAILAAGKRVQRGETMVIPFEDGK